MPVYLFKKTSPDNGLVNSLAISAYLRPFRNPARIAGTGRKAKKSE